MTDELEVVGALLRVARPIILEEWHPNSCIVSTRVACDALGYFGVWAKPAPVVVVAFNALGIEQWDRDGRIDAEGTDAYSVGCAPFHDPTFPMDRPSWDGGHLVAITDSHLIDLSLDQMSRPEKGIPLWPSCFDLDVVLFNRANYASKYVRDDGVVIFYQRATDAPDFRDLNDWSDKGRNATRRKQVTGRVIRAMRDRLSVAVGDDAGESGRDEDEQEELHALGVPGAGME